MRAVDAEIAAQEKELARLEGRQEELEDALVRQREELAQLLRSAYVIGQHGQLQVLLEQGRMNDVARMLAYHRYFQQDRQARITRLSAELASLATVTEQIRVRQQDLVAARARQQTQLAALAAQKRERAGMVTALEAKYRDRNQRIAALGRDEKNTVALLERLRKVMAQIPKPPPPPRTPATPGTRPPPVPTGNANIPSGPMNLPLTGTILAGYGGTMPDGHASQGLLIAGSAGAEVRAVNAGRVAYADWLKGYGLLIILDHGGGWMTLVCLQRRPAQEHRRHRACRRSDFDRRQLRRAGPRGAVFRTAAQWPAAGSPGVVEEVRLSGRGRASPPPAGTRSP